MKTDKYLTLYIKGALSNGDGTAPYVLSIRLSDVSGMTIEQRVILPVYLSDAKYIGHVIDELTTIAYMFGAETVQVSMEYWIGRKDENGTTRTS